mmetsp:Transcript_14654/g.32138  ORF Transcript_14654/g.32138 Transcript_14654/m.32138 type:complete len:271 (+) Transcript_14654:107-919(+)
MEADAELEDPLQLPSATEGMVPSSSVSPLTLRLLSTLTGREFSGDLPEEAVHQITRLRWPVLASFAASLCAYGIQGLCALDGWLVVAREPVPSKCDGLRWWIMFYVVVVSFLPFSLECAGKVAWLAVMSVVAGEVIRSRLPKTCEADVPQHWAFVTEVMNRTLASSVCLLVVLCLVGHIRLQLLHIARRWGSHGPTDEAVISRILTSASTDVPPDAECAICLGEGGLLSGWRVLRCRHAFHEECLTEWLQRSRHCPLCRLDLHMAYPEVP